MALATRCPHCGKTFRVASDQLKLRGGIVRCGACQQIFDGNACLLDLDAVAAEPAADPRRSQTAVVPANAGTHAEQSEAAAAEEPPFVPAHAETHAEPAEAAAAEEAVVPANAGTHTEPSEAGTFEHSTVVPANAGTHAEPSEAAAAEEPPAVPTHAELPIEPAAPAPPPEPNADAEPIYTLDFDHTFDPFGILPKPADQQPAADAQHIVPEPEPLVPQPEPLRPEPEPLEPEPEPLTPEPEPLAPAPEPMQVAHARAPEPHGDLATERRIEPTLDLPVDEELVAAALPGHEPDGPAQPAPAAGATHAPLPMREAAGIEVGAAPHPARPRVAEARPPRRSKLTPTRIAAPRLRVPDIDEPEFVKRSRKAEQSGKTLRIAMTAGSVLLLLALVLQLAVTFRNTLAARYPAAKPALAATCKVFGCRVELPAQIDNLVIETGELTTLGANTYSLATLLRNQGSLVQAWPHVELVLTDANDKPLLRRVFTPTEYLPQGAAPATGFAPHAEQPVKLYFQLDQLKPSGYRIAVFYP